ncbi:Pyrimidine-specific ribonucleoside hydrolase RihA [Mucisphaera calidilacus]|uniref:Pyrimidine-specific ribonucleoside hydrolase RihA n=2 Tax=Mucisphaera calidilacus TaxID=2527982 RepID=A0A518BUG4_9BACT|nr:Pyrimidine-specific ribonucleoside hydrolase RihA [Mucisphaera calidilacus]
MKALDPELLMRRLMWPEGRVRMVLDTDTYNEIDDQFALVYALSSSPRLEVEAVYAAPFHNDRSEGPGHGMELSREEIERIFGLLNLETSGRVFSGSTSWLRDTEGGVASAACDDLIARARASAEDDPLYVVGIGAPTNIASALVAAPDIREKVVVVWLGGHPLYWPTAQEFNLRQDLEASRVLFDSGVPLVLLPCMHVAELARASSAELERYLDGRSEIGTYLSKIFREYEHYPQTEAGRSKQIWDLAPLAWLLDASWVDTVLEASPILTERMTWSRDASRHLIRVARHLDRDPLFADLFAKLG